MKEKVWERPFILDRATPADLEYVEFIRKNKAIFGEYFTEGEKIRMTLKEKIPGTCFDAPKVPWKDIKPGHKLWFESFSNGLLSKSEWCAIRVTKKYNGVLFFRYLEGEKVGKLDHFDQESFAANALLYPYIIKLPENTVLVECYNPKQIYMYV